VTYRRTLVVDRSGKPYPAARLIAEFHLTTIAT
jgi:hypothetical protein